MILLIGTILSRISDVDSSTADIGIKLIHHDGESANASLTERFIFSPGASGDNNDNKLKLINAVANSSGANSRASKAVFSGIQGGTVSI